MSGFVGVVAAVVVEVATPQDGDALAIVARELRLRVASPVVCNNVKSQLLLSCRLRLLGKGKKPNEL